MVKVISCCLLMVALLGGVLGCERELLYVAPSETPIVGYQIEGYVTDHLGIPLKGIRVGLWYDYEFVDAVRIPNPSFVVDDTAKRARIQVLNRSQKIIAVVFEGRAALGVLDLTWDKRDAAGVPAPSGVYTVEFSMNGITRASYSVTVDGAITAVTDSLGHYLIPNENLPVGFAPVPRFSSLDSRFLGNYRITPSIALELYLDVRRAASLLLTKDQVTRRDFTI